MTQSKSSRQASPRRRPVSMRVTTKRWVLLSGRRSNASLDSSWAMAVSSMKRGTAGCASGEVLPVHHSAGGKSGQ